LGLVALLCTLTEEERVFTPQHNSRAAVVTPPFHSPRAFDPSYSLLGRAFRYWTGDRLRGEAFFIVVLTGLALLLLMTHYLGWALLSPLFVDHPSWQMLFWMGQLGSAVGGAVVGLLGFRPAVTVTCTPTTLDLEQGHRSCTVRYDAIERIDTVSATTYYRHYRRYAATRVFVSHLPDEVLLLHTARGPIVVALLDPDAQAALRSHLTTVGVKPFSAVPEPHS
jgi:hypothetical protein